MSSTNSNVKDESDTVFPGTISATLELILQKQGNKVKKKKKKNENKLNKEQDMKDGGQKSRTDGKQFSLKRRNRI